MTKGDLRDYTFEYLGSSEKFGPWTPAAVNRYLEDGHMKMWGMVADTFEDFFSARALLSEVAGVDMVDLPTDFYRLLLLERISGEQATANDPIVMRKIDRTENTVSYLTGTSTAPMYYHVIGQKQIRLLPIPSSDATDSLRMTYIFRPSPMNLDTNVPFQQPVTGLNSEPLEGGAGKDSLLEFHDIMALYAIEKCLLTPGEENMPLAGEIRNMRLEREQELKTYLSRINLQAPRSMDVTGAVWEYD